MTGTVQTFGLVDLDEDGITKRKGLLFGKRFYMRAPEKETLSLMTLVSGGSNSIDAAIARFGEAIGARLEISRLEYPNPSDKECAEILDKTVKGVSATVQGLAGLPAKQLSLLVLRKARSGYSTGCAATSIVGGRLTHASRARKNSVH